ncbi:MAG: phosphate ABC transporter substrate-binding protein [Pseudomonadales bacterium]|nr:phosphate ABC transporter substrate-binding protein [Pseudomonadales bacterium]
MTNMHIKWIITLLALLFGLSMPLAAATAVIVHPQNTNTLDADDIRKIFLGKIKTFPNGKKVLPFDLRETQPGRQAFREKVLRKSEIRLNAYWARMLFSSKAQPPAILKDSDEAKAMVQNTPHAIAYIREALVDKTVKVVMLIE